MHLYKKIIFDIPCKLCRNVNGAECVKMCYNSIYQIEL